MKKAIILFSFIFVAWNFSKAQVFVEGININDLAIEYCQVKVPLTGEYNKIAVDYGQKQKFLNLDYITDNKGQALHFNSDIQFLNFMYQNGWELYQSNISDSLGQIFYIFKKRDDFDGTGF